MTGRELRDLGLDLDNDPDCEVRIPEEYEMLGSIASAFEGEPEKFAAAIELPYDVLTVLMRARTHGNDASLWREKKRMARMKRN